MAAETFVLLIKSGGGGAKGAPAAQQTIMNNFDDAVTKAAAQTGVNVTSRWAAQGAYDFILVVEVDPANWPANAPRVQGSAPSPQQIAIGFGAALGQNAGVTTQTVSAVPLDQNIKAIALHSCT